MAFLAALPVVAAEGGAAAGAAGVGAAGAGAAGGGATAGMLGRFGMGALRTGAMSKMMGGSRNPETPGDTPGEPAPSAQSGVKSASSTYAAVLQPGQFH